MHKFIYLHTKCRQNQTWAAKMQIATCPRLRYPWSPAKNGDLEFWKRRENFRKVPTSRRPLNETLRPATVQKLETTISDGGTTSRNPLAVTNIHASGFCCWKMMMSSPWWWGTRWVCRLVFLFGLVKAWGRISEEGAQWLQPSILVFRLDVELFSVFQ